jgi:hypothetical protein
LASEVILYTPLRFEGALGEERQQMAGSAPVRGQGRAIRIEQFQADNRCRLKHQADFASGIALFNSPERTARYSGTIRQILRGQPALLPAKLYELAEQCGGIRAVARIGPCFPLPHDALYRPVSTQTIETPHFTNFFE